MESDKNYKETDLKKDLDLIKNYLLDLSSGVELERHKTKILNYYTNPPSRILKSLSYPLIKSLKSLDIGSVLSTISSDISSDDVEVQLNALKLLYNLGPSDFLGVIQSKEKEILSILNNTEFNYERLVCFSDALLKNFIISYSSEDREELKEMIMMYYMRIAELIFGSNRDLTRNALEVVLTVFENYNNNYCDLYIMNYYFDGNGSTKNLLKPLVIKLTNILLNKMEVILSKILTYETRLRSHLMTFIVLFLEVLDDLLEKKESKTFKANFHSIFDENAVYLAQDGGGQLCIKEFIENLLNHHLFENIMKGTYEIDLLLNTSINIFRILNIVSEDNSLYHMDYHKKCEFIYEVFLYLIKIIPQLLYKRELNIIALNTVSFAKGLNISYCLKISLKILELTINNIQTLMTRITSLMVIFDNLLHASIRLCKLNKKSSLYCLFQQQWFLKKVKEAESNPIPIREELVISLLTMTLNYLKNNEFIEKHREAFYSLLIESLDISYTLIEWNYKNNNKAEARYKYLILAINVYLILLKKALELYPIEKFHNQVFEIIKRLASNEMIFEARLKAIHILSSHLENSSYKSHIEFRSIILDFKNTLFPEQKGFYMENFVKSIDNQSTILTYLNNMEQIFSCLFIFAKKISSPENDLISDVVTLFTDFIKHLEEISNPKVMCMKMIEAIKETCQSVLNMLFDDEEANLDRMKVPREWFESINTENSLNKKPHNEPKDTFYIAFNIFSLTILQNKKVFLNEFIESDKPIKNLRNTFLGIDKEKISNYRFCKPKLITGYADILQIYASHAIFTANGLISFNLALFNMCNFALNNVKIQILHSDSVEIFASDINNSAQTVEEIQSNTRRNLFFTLKVNSIEIVSIYFEITIEGEDTYVFRTIPYKLGLTNFLLANEIIELSQDFFDENWNSMRLHAKFKCRLDADFKKINNIFKNKNFAVILISAEERKEIFSQGNKQNRTDISLGLMSFSWDGFSLAILVSEINREKSSQICLFEIKTNKFGLIERIKEDLEFFLMDVSDGNLNLI